MSVCASAGIFATTIQAQDFKDTEGDRLIGRKTLPIVAPLWPPPTLMLALQAWSIGLALFWQVDVITAFAFNFLSLLVGYRYISLKSIPEDQVSFYLSNVSLQRPCIYSGSFDGNNSPVLALCSACFARVLEGRCCIYRGD